MTRPGRGGPVAPPPAEEIMWARHRRAYARAGAGLLDLVLPLREGGAGPALFCAPPLLGLSWCYLALLPHLDPAHPLYGLQSRGLRRPEPLPVDMAELARDFADQIRLTQPSGPYHLLGWSIGGNIAFAIAEELERRGHEVGLLIILDATPQFPTTLPATKHPTEICNFILYELGYKPAVALDDPDPEARMLALVRERPGLALGEWPDRRVLALPRVIRNNIAVAQSFRLGRVRCPMFFIAATRSGPDTAAKLARWREHVDGRLDAVEVDCRHEYMLLPQQIARIGAESSARLSGSSAD